MLRLWTIAAVFAMASHALADDAGTKAQLECENAAYAQYKKDVDALYNKIIARTVPITVQEVLADRRITEAYCLKEAACGAKNGDKPESLGRNFQSCLDAEARDQLKELDEIYRDSK